MVKSAAPSGGGNGGEGVGEGGGSPLVVGGGDSRDYRDLWKACDKEGVEATTVAVTGYGPGGIHVLKKMEPTAA